MVCELSTQSPESSFGSTSNLSPWANWSRRGSCNKQQAKIYPTYLEKCAFNMTENLHCLTLNLEQHVQHILSLDTNITCSMQIRQFSPKWNTPITQFQITSGYSTFLFPSFKKKQISHKLPPGERFSKYITNSFLQSWSTGIVFNKALKGE